MPRLCVLTGSSMFRHRALSAAIGLPVLFGLLYLDGFAWAFGLPLLVVVVVVSVIGAEELRRMLCGRGLHPPEDTGKMMGALPPLFLYFYHHDYNDVVLLLLTLVIVVDVLMLALALIGDIGRRVSARAKQDRECISSGKAGTSKQEQPPPPGGSLGAMRDFVLTAVGALYIGGLMSYLIFLRRLDDSIVPRWGIWPVVLLIAAVWIADTAAFAVGKVLDGPKLWPRVSPGKTIGGTAAGIGGCAVVFAIAAAGGLFAGPFQASVGAAAIVGGLIGVANLGGDLTESAVKRWAQVKDSGNMFPGHGGVLDRFDGLLWAAPVCFYALTAIRGAM